MGQAKNRGDFEQRKSQSIAMRLAEEKERVEREKKCWEALSPEEKEAEIERMNRRRRIPGFFAPWSEWLY